MKNLILYYNQNFSYVFSQFVRHFLISIYGALLASIISIPLGFLIARNKKLSNFLISIANVLQTVPSLVMLAILMFVMGIGPTTVVFVVFLYFILPILKNTVAGIISISKNLIDASKGMGMTRYQIMAKIELPLSLSIIMGKLETLLSLPLALQLSTHLLVQEALEI
ncbi:ABC transporter permease [Peptoniphilus raoultii]|uniref:ABC transporter permease n=1 Tax=Peptoniphilus raoultii TaxID=1776387 RepID=UPI002FF4E8B9